MEETDMRLSEMKKESYEFERDILKGSVNHRTNKVIAEKCLRYFDDKLRARVSIFLYSLKENKAQISKVAAIEESASQFSQIEQFH